MRILHLGKYYYPYLGGIESVVKSICEGVQQSGADVSVLCSHEQPSLKEEAVNAVKVTRSPRYGVVFSQPLNLLLWKDLIRQTKTMDVVHVHSPNPLAEFFTLLLPKHIPVVVTYHSDIVRQRILKHLYTPFQKLFLKRVDRIIVPTENHINYSPVLPEFRDKCSIIPFGIETSDFKKNEQIIQKIWEIKQHYGKFALFVGRLVNYKGLHILVDAMKNVPHRLVIMGDGPEREAIKNQIKQLGLEDKVILLGRVETLEFQAFYHACEVFTFPSITSNENFGVVQLEAMACKKPIVNTALKSGAAAVGIPGRTCLQVPPSDPVALAQAINRLFDNPQMAKEMGERGYERFLERYTYNQMIDLHMHLYGRLIDTGSVIKRIDKKAA